MSDIHYVSFRTFLFICVLIGASGLRIGVIFKQKMKNLAYARPTDGTSFRKFLPGEYKEDALTPEIISKLEETINRSFKERNMEIVPGYFSSRFFNQNFRYMILAESGLVEPNLVGGLIAFSMRTNEGLPFILYDKLFFLPEFRNRGHLGRLFHFARMLDIELAGNGSGARYYPIAGLRTSHEETHKKYTNYSDTQFQIKPSSPDGIKYFTHIFGSNSYSMRRVAEYIAQLKPSMRKVIAPIQVQEL